MMKTKIILVMLSGVFVTGIANAECPASLDKNELIKCQAIEKKGANYQKWLETRKELAEKSKISPITGEDVTTVAPAAGTAGAGSKPAE